MKLPLSRCNGVLLGSFTCPRLPRRLGRPEVAGAAAGAHCASVPCLWQAGMLGCRWTSLEFAWELYLTWLFLKDSCSEDGVRYPP